MSKRRRDIWDESSLEFQPVNSSSHADHMPELYDVENSIEETEFLDDAHEALSKLFNKTNKRARQMRGVRRKDAWQ